jgi:myosin heavy subunit
VGDKLYELEQEEERLYNSRHSIGQIADQKKKASDEATWHPDAPAEPVPASALISQQQELLAKNGENQRKREQAAKLVERQGLLIRQIAELSQELERVETDLATAMKTAEQLTDESTAELEKSIAEVDEINAKVRANQAKSLLDDEANTYKGQYDELTEKIESIRAEKVALLDGADLPLPGLSVEAGELTYNGHQWDAMSGSEQLKVATAIVRKLNPNCGFVLLDKLEQMDLDTLTEFGAWLTEQGLQVIATRVSTGDECSIVIEDGYAVEPDAPAPGSLAAIQRQVDSGSWKPGEF